MFTERWSSREQDIAQEWIQRDSEKRCLGRLFGCCPFSCYKRVTIMCYYVTFFTCGAITAAILVVLAVSIVKPFKETLNYKESNCMTYDKKYNESIPMSCSCGGTCTSVYPCVKIYVWYFTEDGTNVTSMLQDSEKTESCTFKPVCKEDRRINQLSVEKYDREYGILGKNFSCLYDPDDENKVIREHHGSLYFSIHLLLWPSVILVLCALGFLMIYHVCGCKYVCRVNPTDDIKAEAAANPLVASEATPAGIVITEVPPSTKGDSTGETESQVPLVSKA